MQGLMQETVVISIAETINGKMHIPIEIASEMFKTVFVGSAYIPGNMLKHIQSYGKSGD